MPSISFVADEDDFRTVLAYLNDHPEVAFIVADGPGRWRAVQALEQLDIDRIALWHIPSGALPADSGQIRPAGRTHPRPMARLGRTPYLATTAIVPTSGLAIPESSGSSRVHRDPGPAHGVGISEFQWIGNHYSVIGLGAAPATERFWKNLRRWIVRQTTSRASTGDSRAFPSAMARIRAAAGTPDPAPE